MLSKKIAQLAAVAALGAGMALSPQSLLAQTMTINITTATPTTPRGITVPFNGNFNFAGDVDGPSSILFGEVSGPGITGSYLGPVGGGFVTGQTYAYAPLFDAKANSGVNGLRTGQLRIRWADKNGDIRDATRTFQMNVTPAPPALLVMLFGGVGTGFAVRRSRKKAGAGEATPQA